MRWMFAVGLCLAIHRAPHAKAGDRPTAPPPRPAGLTGAKAKRALLDLMDTRERGLVARPDIKRFADAPVEAGADPHEAFWGPFALKLTDRRYRFTLEYGSGPKSAVEVYEGTFELRDGAWVALPPRLTIHALRGKDR